MRVLIVGAGSVGLGMASCLLKSGHEARLVARPSAGEALSARGLRRTGLFGGYECGPSRFAISADIAQVRGEPMDYALVCVKSYDSARVAEVLRDSATTAVAQAKIVLCQNGYGNVEMFSEALGAKRVFAARVITGFRRLAPHHVDITVHAAPVHVGSFVEGRSDEVADLCSALSTGDLPTRVSHHIDADLWAKILYNSMLNPLGAIVDATYGELGESATARPIMEGIAAEGFAVMLASGHSTHWPHAQAFLKAFYTEMLPPTREHESSMLQSIRAGQRTEIEALNGALARLGREFGIETPHNDRVTAQVRELEGIAGARVGGDRAAGTMPA